MRSVAEDWRKASIIAVDAGVHLSAITRLLKESIPSPPPSPPHTLTTGPFAGLTLPYKTAEANAGYITSSLVEAYLITHPHMDHIAGFVVNTAGPPGARPKKLAGLPGTIHAFKTHIFNNVIWPNLSDENNGAGLVTYLRLVEGGSPALGDGPGRGYSEVCDGLLVKIWGVSHGHCIEKHSHRGSASSASGLLAGLTGHEPSAAAAAAAANQHQPVRRETIAHIQQTTPRRQSLLSQATFASNGPGSPHGGGATSEQDKYCVYDSSAYFIQSQDRHREVLIFGDVEPDSISLSPRNQLIWQEAAPKVASGSLGAIFIECSYDDSRSIDRLFGHLKPAFVIEELRALALEVAAARKDHRASAATNATLGLGPQDSTKKRKRSDTGGGSRKDSIVSEDMGGDGEAVSPKTSRVGDEDVLATHRHPHPPPPPPPPPPGSVSSKNAVKGGQPRVEASHTSQATPPTRELSFREPGDVAITDHPVPELEACRGQLEGLKVVIIHIKEKLTDEEDLGGTILRELQEYDNEVPLGCEFVIARSGQSLYF